MEKPLTQIPPHVVSLSDYEALAQSRVESGAWAYISGGAGDELTLRENVDAFRRLQITPRVFKDMAGGSTSVDMLGRRWIHPILVAPMAFHQLMHPDGEIGTVLGAAAMETPVVVSTQSGISLEEIAKRAMSPLWFQLYIQPDRQFTSDLVRRAEAAGYEALVVTADAPLSGLRNREQRAGFRLPDGISPVNLKGMASLPPEDRVFGGALVQNAPTWKDLQWLQGQTRLPVLVKGILNPEDARIAMDQGVGGIVVSNHGGRTLDGLPAAIEVLPEVVDAVSGHIPVLLDGGIRRGTDIFKALALGATAVMVGRPVLYGLAAAGAVGVGHVLKILRTELEMAMVLAGTATISEINRSALRRGSV
ncbi:alpha-hydroxy-acid oxidizing protein [Luteolibacter pohnpeiensis]|uniref:Alpha-hydroxy-acid oxidizing protein n=2 Tax=Luteolibacter pohnpeiensis TaxID=454153 RepID=A0A934S6V3_9BACT|nr:alpha-hydroxy-acid oxidizing protein [Luteolibacter pohnpeiensis]